VLDANPPQDVNNIRKISMVMKDGRSSTATSCRRRRCAQRPARRAGETVGRRARMAVARKALRVRSDRDRRGRGGRRACDRRRRPDRGSSARP
jgi:hypothetical protein